MNKITLFDTAEGSHNLGDEIIMDYCCEVLRRMLPKAYFLKLPVHLDTWRDIWANANTSSVRFVCGTNILRGGMLKKRNRQWRLNPVAGFKIKDVCLMGVGWNNYQVEKIDLYSKLLYKSLLSKQWMHSVRDMYTLGQLKTIGVENVIYTGCPTMWKLTSEHCKQIPKNKSKCVLTTITDYRKDVSSDSFLLNTLHKCYDQVYFWPQGLNDLDYLSELSVDFEPTILNPDLKALDELLDSDLELDYIGTRLHCGIRAMNFKRRTIIVAVDNRATEIAKDTNLNVIQRNDLQDKLLSTIYDTKETSLVLPFKNIETWIEQFNSLN